MRKTIINEAQKLINLNKLEEASHALEFLLTTEPKDIGTRFALAQIYITLKENNFRAKARHHLEYLVTITEGDSLKKILKLLIFNVYLTNGPVFKAKNTIDVYGELFSEEEVKFINLKTEELNLYIEKNNVTSQRSILPPNISDLEFFDHAVKNFIFNQFNENTKRSNKISKFFTFGSCFAGNVAREMKRKGIDVESFWVGEEINTVFSNINLIKFILGIETPYLEYYQELLANSDVKTLKEKLKKSEAVIFTLGVAPAFFNSAGEYVPHAPSNLKNLLRSKDADYRMSTVAENFNKLVELKKILQNETSVSKVFLTVSPVPMSASLMSRSTAVDDTESKAILRTVAGEICRKHSDYFTYFPSFEVFRWLPCFRNYSAFGLEDGSTRHANSDMVSLVVEEFINATAREQS